LLLDVFAMVAFMASESEQALFEEGILAVPQCNRKAEPALPIRDAEQTVFTPAIGAAAGVVVGKVLSTRARFRVVLPHGGPLAFAEIGAPALPIILTGRILFQALRLGCARGAVDEVGATGRTHDGIVTASLRP
jgi:hypothetical protein